MQTCQNDLGFSLYTACYDLKSLELDKKKQTLVLE